MRVLLVLTFLTLICSSAFAADDPDLVFYFQFEEFSGNTAEDQSGNGHKGTINGDIKITDGGKFGRAAEFATNSFIDMDGPNFPADLIPRDEMTLCAWINLKNTGGDHAIFNARAADRSEEHPS